MESQIIVFDQLIDIESNHEIEIYFFRFSRFLLWNRVPVKVEVPVEWIQTDDW